MTEPVSEERQQAYFDRARKGGGELRGRAAGRLRRGHAHDDAHGRRAAVHRPLKAELDQTWIDRPGCIRSPPN